MEPIYIPSDVSEYLKSVFDECNYEVARSMTHNPNMYETTLDNVFITQLAKYATPVTFGSGWTVKFETHFLGGRHLYRNWEVADIGFLVMFMRAGQLQRSKVALLQSKRLYPIEVEFEEDTFRNYEIGFARLYRENDELPPITEPRVFTFEPHSRYEALKKGDRQYEVIKKYEKEKEIPVHYLLYHPLQLPSSCKVPLESGYEIDISVPNSIGCRVICAEAIREALKDIRNNQSPCYGDLQVRLPEPYNVIEHEVGWRLEHFITQLLITCEEGYIAENRLDRGLFEIFNRRSGPITAAVSVTFDAP